MADAESDNEGDLTMELLMRWKLVELKSWCSKKKLKISGKKEEVARRVYRAMTFHSDSEADLSDSEDESKVVTISRPDMWETMTQENLPPVREDDVKNYFVFHKNPTSGKTLNFGRQLKKARTMSVERYVYDVKIGRSSNPDGLIYVKSNCQASMKVKSYAVMVCLVSETGMVHSGECSCKAGQSGVCSHIGALLLTVVRTQGSCTSKSCSWKAPSASAQPLEAAMCADIVIYNPERVADQDLKKRPYPGVYQAGPPIDKTNFVNDLLDSMATCNSDCALYKMLRSEPRDIQNFMSNFEVKYQFCDKVDIEDESIQGVFIKFVDDLHISSEVLQELEKSTRGQGVNPNWVKARSVVITASNMGNIVKRKKVELDSLVSRLMYPKFITGVKSLSYGRKNEARARREYARWHMKRCGAIEIEDRGLIISSTMPYLGASVDGIVMCEKCGTGLVEIKCPYGNKSAKWRSMEPADCAKSAEFCCEMTENELKLKTGHYYHHQVQGQMAVCNVDWVDFTIWTKKGLSVQRIQRDEEFWGEMMPKLKSFYVKGVTAELFTSRLKRNRQLSMIR